ncbi:MAG: IS110 family transposase [Planctomycetes bacterium]|nr:IS110 family transposase [Planctomycetota bacterium]
MSYYVGIDLHSNNNFIGIIDEENRRVFKKKTINDLSEITKTLYPYKSQIQGIVVESTFNWYWIVDGLMDAGYRVHLANPSAIKQYEGLKYTDDVWDSFWLAHLLRLGILPEGHIYPKEIRPIRDLLRKRLMLVHHKTAHILSMQSMVSRNNGIQMDSNAIKTMNVTELSDLFKDEHLQMSASCNYQAINFFSEQIYKIEKAVLSKVKLQEIYKKLLTVPGIGKILAITIMLETGNINRFREVGNYSSYCRCVSSTKFSNGKNKGKGNKKNGNRYLAWAYIEASLFARRYSPEAHRWYQRKMSKSNRMIAAKALSNKLARACYYIMRDQVPYDPAKIFQ